MSARPKSRRRLFILLTSAVAAAALFAGAWAFRKHQLNNNARAARAEGMVYSQKHEYPQAITKLGQYLSRFPTDTDALFHYAEARQNVPLPRNAHMVSALNLWRQLLDLDPGNVEARRRLLALFQRFGYHTETLECADALLNQVPKDSDAAAEAYRAQAVARTALGNYDKARVAADSATELRPLNVDGQLGKIYIMLKGGHATTRPKSLDPDQQNIADVDAYLAGLAAKYPDNAAILVVRAVANADLAGRVPRSQQQARMQAARDAISQATRLKIDDVDLLKTASAVLDGLGMYSESVTLCEKAAAEHAGDQEIQRFFATRLFLGAQYTQVESRLASLDPADPSSDGQLLALRAMALVQLDRAAEAAALVSALEKRAETDRLGAALASAIRAAWLEPDGDPRRRLDTCRDALTADSASPFLLHCYAESLAAVGELDMAVAQEVRAQQQARVWAVPLVRAGWHLYRLRRFVEAYPVAAAARDRVRNGDALVLEAVTRAEFPAELNGKAGDALLQTCVEIERDFPRALDIRPLHIKLLARQKRRDDALRVARDTLAAQPPPGADVFTQLVATSFSHKLGLEEEIFAAWQKAAGQTPDLALTRAFWLVENHHASDGLVSLKQACQGHSEAPWRLVMAQFLDLTKDPAARQAWASLTADFPNDLNVQRSALSSPSVLADRALSGAAIDRLRAQLGSDGLSVQVARARWLLQQDSPSEKDLAEATALLSDVVRAMPRLADPHLLLAECMEKLNNFSGALGQVREVIAIQSGDSQAEGQATQPSSSDAGAATRPAARTVDPALRLRAAHLLAMMKDTQGSRAQLALIDTDKLPPGGRLLLAKQSLPIDAVWAIELFETVDVHDPATDLVFADAYMRLGQAQKAQALCQRVQQSDPGNSRVWPLLLGPQIDQGNVEEVARLTKQARAALPRDESLQVLEANLDLFRKIAPTPALRTVFMQMLRSPADRPAILEALHVLSETTAPGKTLGDVLAGLQSVARRYPKVYPVQAILVNYEREAGQFDEAIALARRLLAEFPDEPNAARLLHECCTKSYRWSEAEDAAREWKLRLPKGNTREPDLALALALSHQNKLDEALAQLDGMRAGEDPLVLSIKAQIFSAKAEQSPAPLKLQFNKTAADLFDRSIAPADSSDDLLFAAAGFYDIIARQPDADRTPGSGILRPGQKAEDLYRRVVDRGAKNPAAAIACNNLAMILLDRKNTGEALALADRAIAIQPNVPSFYDTRAAVCAAAGDYDRGLAAIDEAIKIEPKNPEWRVTRIWLLSLAHNPDKARAEYEVLQKLNLSTLSGDAKTRLKSSGFQ